jgi:hypothetical protein
MIQKMRSVLFEMGDEVEVRAEYRQLARKLFNTNVFFEMIRCRCDQSPGK